MVHSDAYIKKKNASEKVSPGRRPRDAIVSRIDYERNYRSRININFHEARARGF